MKKLYEDRICKNCKETFKIKIKNKIRKYCDECKDVNKISRLCKSRIKKEIENKFNLIDDMNITYTGKKGYGIIYKKKIYFGYSKDDYNKESIIDFLESIKKEIEENIENIKKNK